MRKTGEELNLLMKENGADRIWSWSKISGYKTDPYSYLLKYIKKISPDKPSNAYSFFGTIVHDMLEEFYSGNLTNEDMLNKFEEKTIVQEISGIRFDANDERNESISNKYITCVKHFLREYNKDENAKLEQFVYGWIGNHFFQGYVDKMHVKDDCLYIDDFKTSTKYSPKKAEVEKGQLLLYAILLNKMYPKIPIEKIKIRWNFLKYVSIDCEQVNGKTVTMDCERNQIGEKLTAKMKTWLKKSKYDENEIEDFINQVKYLNTIEYKDRDCIDCLPDDVKSKFNIRDCTIEANFTETDIIAFIHEISKRCEQIIEKEEIYKDTQNDMLFWINIDEKNSFYFTNLCDYSTKYHMPLKKYHEEWEKMNSNNTDSQISAIQEFLFQD